MNRVRVIVSGKVQGVSFRDECRRKAIENQVCGWVRNQSDGSVEAVFEGAAGAVQTMLGWVRVGPPAASVARVEVHLEEPAGLDGFTIEI